ncbi:hypothetical protein BO78DRAFT_25456 [Aspergillus sclerotiicarbonarius CBS 121057]|uniref:Uncharacterized protein n=1 Tax=Aspergillus sclerotiicarbonarius (strain CBS 121057 / IBT 28362) TaxID=1448318 RepID=A0A319DTR4_ASPSB|nr:hypothetical protein BO78DRAFT_25456 [Aspergillus sclerotiicarbonarius CBS 121057]
MDTLIKGIAAGVGLASESVSAYKASRQEKKARRSTEAEERAQLVDEQHEQDWALDEAQDGLTADRQAAISEPASGDIETLADSFLQGYPTLPPYPPPGSKCTQTSLSGGASPAKARATHSGLYQGLCAGA